MTTSPTRHLLHIAIAGLIGQLAFEAYAWLISPALFGPALEPANLVAGISNLALGIQLSYAQAFAIHLIIGSLGFGAVVWGLQKVTNMGWIWSGAITGLALWFVAQGILAPAMGRDFMMGFGTYTQSSFVSHVGMAMIMGAVFKRLQSSPAREDAQAARA